MFISTNAKVVVDGHWEIENFENSYFRYTGSGMIRISGDAIKVIVSGKVALLATGKGEAILIEHWEYKVFKRENSPWAIS